MKRIGVRAFKTELTSHLNDVADGDVVILADRGEDVAVISPPGAPVDTALLASLVSNGTITWRNGRPPLPAKRTVVRGRPLSETLIEDRGD